MTTERPHATGIVLGHGYQDELTRIVGPAIAVFQEVGGTAKALLQWVDDRGDRLSEWIPTVRLRSAINGQAPPAPTVIRTGDVHEKTGLVFGRKYYDEMHRTEGHLTRISDYLYGCARVTVERVNNEGRLIESVYDAPELVDAETNKKPVGSAPLPQAGVPG